MDIHVGFMTLVHVKMLNRTLKKIKSSLQLLNTYDRYTMGIDQILNTTFISTSNFHVTYKN
jgi:hypothetical protein